MLVNLIKLIDLNNSVWGSCRPVVWWPSLRLPRENTLCPLNFLSVVAKVVLSGATVGFSVLKTSPEFLSRLMTQSIDGFA